MTRKYNLTFLLILSSSFFASGQQRNFDSQKADDEIRRLIEKTNSAGTSVIITNPDTIIYRGQFGIADIENNISVTDETLFGLGSITKTFTALGILKLIEAEKLKLTDKVFDIAPELPITNKWERDYPVRIFHLLEHTSGFDELHPKDRTIPISNDEYPLFNGITHVKNSLMTRWEPGSRFAYSNVGYLVAGYIIEKVSGKNYNDFIKTEVLNGLRMNQSAIKLDEIKLDLLAKSYSSNKKELPFKHVFTRPTASLYSSANDMSKFLQMLLNKGKMDYGDFLSTTNFNDFETHHSIRLFQNTENGYRLGVFPRFYNGVKWYGHGGSFNQYNSEFEYCHELQIGIFVVSNGPNSTKTVDGILEILHNQFNTNTKGISSNALSKSNNSFTGYFIPISPRNQLLYPFTELFNGGLHIKNRNNQLFISGIDSPEKRLYITGGNKLSSSKSNLGYQYIFDPARNTLLTSLGFAYERKSLILMVTLVLMVAISIGCLLISQIVLGIKTIKTIWNKEGFAIRAQTLLELSGTIILIGLISFLISAGSNNIHEPNAASVILFLTTISFPLLTIIGVAYLIKDKLRKRSFLSKIYLLGLTSSLIFSVSYLYYWDLLAFKIWSY